MNIHNTYHFVICFFLLNNREEDETGDGKKPKAEKSSANGVTAATSTPKRYR